MSRMRLNPLPSKAEYAAFDRLLENPSKGFLNIKEEAKRQGGWIEEAGVGERLVCVLAGPFTGTYTFSRPRVMYNPDLETTCRNRLAQTGLWWWKTQEVNKRLAPLLPVVFDALRTVGQEETRGAVMVEEQRKKDLIKRMGRLQAALDPREYEARAEVGLGFDHGPANEWEAEPWDEIVGQMPPPPPGRGRPRDTAWKAKSEITAIKRMLEETRDDVYGLLNPSSYVNRISRKIYILAQVGGVDVGSVVKAIQEQPKRIFTFVDTLSVPGKRPERARWARALVTTFSEDEALKALFPNVEGVKQGRISPHDQRDTPLVRYALNHYPSWIQVAERLVPADATRPEWSSGGRVERPLTKAERRKEGTAELLGRAEGWKELGVASSDFRYVLEHFTKEQMSLMTDTIASVQGPDEREAMAETVEGRRVLQHMADKNWREILRDHDFATGVARQVRDRRYAAQATGDIYAAATDEACERFHKRALKFNFIPGVRPLTTLAEFTREGDEMRHCVGGYFFQRRSWCFAFVAPDGSRATLELGGDGSQRQFFGPENSSPSAAARRMLAEFKEANRLNLVAMRSHAFPPKEEVVLENENIPVYRPRFQPVRRAGAARRHDLFDPDDGG